MEAILIALIIMCVLSSLIVGIYQFYVKDNFIKDYYITDARKTNVWDCFINMAKDFAYEGTSNHMYYFYFYDNLGRERYCAIVCESWEGDGKCAIFHCTYMNDDEKAAIRKELLLSDKDDEKNKRLFAKDIECCLSSFNKDKSNEMAELLMKKVK